VSGAEVIGRGEYFRYCCGIPPVCIGKERKAGREGGGRVGGGEGVVSRVGTIYRDGGRRERVGGREEGVRREGGGSFCVGDGLDERGYSQGGCVG